MSVRQLEDDTGETSDTVVYMQSVAESSLTEDLSRYDFSYSQVLHNAMFLLLLPVTMVSHDVTLVWQ